MADKSGNSPENFGLQMEQWEDIKSSILAYPDELKDRILTALQQEKLERWKKEWNVDAILEDLRKNHVTIEKNIEMFGHKWNIVHVDLPAAWNWKFNWFSFSYFVWDYVRNEDFEENLEKSSYSVERVWQILKSINEYMKASRVKDVDVDMDYKNELNIDGGIDNCKAWDYLKRITDLDSSYRLKNNKVLNLVPGYCGFTDVDFDSDDMYKILFDLN